MALAVGSNRIHVSSDGGENWARKTNGLLGFSFSISSAFIGNGIMLAGGLAVESATGFTLSPIFRSVDGGETWGPTAVAGVTSETQTRIFTMAGLGTTLFAGDQALGIFRSTDNGATWTSANTGIPDFNGQRVVNKLLAAHGKVFAAVSTSGLWVTTTGDGWSEANAFFSRAGAPETRFLGKDLALAEDGTLYAMMENAYVYRSANAGGTWTQVADTLPGANMIPLNLLQIETVGNTLFVLGQDFSQAGGPVKVYQTENRGDSWTEVALAGVDRPGFGLLQGAHGYLYLNGQTGLYRMQVAAAAVGPRLSYSFTNRELKVCWPTDGKAYRLQRATAIAGDWETEPAVPASTGGNDCVTVAVPNAGLAFYRLVETP